MRARAAETTPGAGGRAVHASSLSRARQLRRRRSCPHLPEVANDVGRTDAMLGGLDDRSVIDRAQDLVLIAGPNPICYRKCSPAAMRDDVAVLFELSVGASDRIGIDC